jgi:hypothetical protein
MHINSQNGIRAKREVHKWRCSACWWLGTFQIQCTLLSPYFCTNNIISQYRMSTFSCSLHFIRIFLDQYSYTSGLYISPPRSILHILCYPIFGFGLLSTMIGYLHNPYGTWCLLLRMMIVLLSHLYSRHFVSTWKLIRPST